MTSCYDRNTLTAECEPKSSGNLERLRRFYHREEEKAVDVFNRVVPKQFFATNSWQDRGKKEMCRITMRHIAILVGIVGFEPTE